MKPSKHFETRAIRTQSERSSQGEHSAPIYATSSFIFEDAEHARALFSNEIEGNIYSRYSNPNNDEFIDKLCLLEGCEDGMAMASGMAAMFTSMAAFLNQGDHLLICRSVFGSTHQITTQLLPRWGITHTYVDIDRPESWESAVEPNTKMFFLETPSNPGLDIIDLGFASAICKKHGIMLNVDNCFATPYIQQPALWGADIVTHSATKFIDGQGRVLGGAILGPKKIIEKVRFFARHTGPAMSPFHGWLLSKSLETLPVRMEKHCENAMNLALFLEEKNGVNWVKYPFLPKHPQHDIARKQMKLGGGLVTFELDGGLKAGQKFWDNIRMISRSSNLGDTRTIATHPASTTHSKLSAEERAAVGITDGLIRISVGLEHIDDIISDISQAVDQADG
ncbi:MAG TPA: O-succinylhomoserine sulfhydrylase [Cytophagales bacterium]|jgi:O-succinylhomoserine sulfhydrylase|nr:O-succinylhomoserine sulfhydrylase [Cytophagales bacterium]